MGRGGRKPRDAGRGGKEQESTRICFWEFYQCTSFFVWIDYLCIFSILLPDSLCQHNILKSRFCEIWEIWFLKEETKVLFANAILGSRFRFSVRWLYCYEEAIQTRNFRIEKKCAVNVAGFWLQPKAFLLLFLQQNNCCVCLNLLRHLIFLNTGIWCIVSVTNDPMRIAVAASCSACLNQLFVYNFCQILFSFWALIFFSTFYDSVPFDTHSYVEIFQGFAAFLVSGKERMAKKGHDGLR